MQYILVENNQSVLLGPIFWRHRFIQSELDDLEVDFEVPQTEPNSTLSINSDLTIYPVQNIATPDYDATFEALVGPVWAFTTEGATGSYTNRERDLEHIKADLKALAASERYTKEIAGVKTTIQGLEVIVDTTRDGRTIFTQMYGLMGDDKTTDWKFPEGWLTLSKADLGAAVAAGLAHIEAQFVWERQIAEQIDAATTVEQLKAITIVEQTQPEQPVGV